MTKMYEIVLSVGKNLINSVGMRSFRASFKVRIQFCRCKKIMINYHYAL